MKSLTYKVLEIITFFLDSIAGIFFIIGFFTHNQNYYYGVFGAIVLSIIINGIMIFGKKKR